MTSHYLEFSHSPEDINWVVLEQVPYSQNCEQILFEKEQRWIFRLRTHIHGLNDAIPWNALSK